MKPSLNRNKGRSGIKLTTPLKTRLSPKKIWFEATALKSHFLKSHQRGAK